MTAVTIFGAFALTFMMVMYALEKRHPRFVLGFALGCALSAVYGFAAGTWPFGVVEAVWCGIALQRFFRVTAPERLIEDNVASSPNEN